MNSFYTQGLLCGNPYLSRLGQAEVTVCQATGSRPGAHGVVKNVSACGLPRRHLSCAGSTLAPAGIIRFRSQTVRLLTGSGRGAPDCSVSDPPRRRWSLSGAPCRTALRGWFPKTVLSGGMWSGTSMATAGSRAGSPKKCRGAVTATRSRRARFQVSSKRCTGTRLVGCSATPRLPRLAVLAQATGSSLPQSLRYDGWTATRALALQAETGQAHRAAFLAFQRCGGDGMPPSWNGRRETRVRGAPWSATASQPRRVPLRPHRQAARPTPGRGGALRPP